jgi:DNA-binding CsgD family transcriptional regulator
MKKKHTNWAALLDLARTELAEDEVVILRLLADGKSTPEIARITGVSRSMIWRKSQRLRTQLEAKLASGEPLSNPNG